MSPSRTKRLSEICRVKYGKGLAKKDRQAGNVPVLGSNGPVGSHIVAITKSPCIVIGRKGSIGKLHYSDIPCWPIDTAYYLDELNTEIDSSYLFYFLHTAGLAGKNKAGAIPSLLRPDLEAVEVPVPPLDEQRRIVARIKECMERVEEIEGLRAEASEDLEYLPSAVFADYVESLNHSELGDSVLGDVVTDCKYGTSKKANTSGKGCPVLRMGNIQAGRLDISDLKHIALPKTERKKYLLQEGDILINRTNSLELVGKSAVFTGLLGDWVYASYLIRLRIDSAKALPQYVNAVINSRIGRGYVYRTARRAIGMVNINAKEIQRMPLPLPPLDEQAALVEKMNEAAPLIDELTSFFQEDGISHLRESILRKAFAGEL